MYCPNCGTSVPYGINVCQRCGSVMPKENYENAPGFSPGGSYANLTSEEASTRRVPFQNNTVYSQPNTSAQNYAPYGNMQNRPNISAPNGYQNYNTSAYQTSSQNVYTSQQAISPKKKSTVGSTIGNIIWFIFGGFESAILLWLIGGIYCLTIIGIPLGVQICKFGTLSLAPFKKEIEYTSSTGKMIVNIIWLLFGGLESAFYFAVLGILFCITIIGIPFGKQYFKFAKLMLMPFGAKLVDKQ